MLQMRCRINMGPVVFTMYIVYTNTTSIKAPYNDNKCNSISMTIYLPGILYVQEREERLTTAPSNVLLFLQILGMNKIQ